ncbi:MAG: hypothetical protein U0835_12175 [Isosphaeraceae bacterium]
MNRRLVTLALLLAMTVTALEQTVVSTAMPSIIAALNGLDIYPWVFSACLLASSHPPSALRQARRPPGAKRVLLVGLLLFGVGSVLSGLARHARADRDAGPCRGSARGRSTRSMLTLLGDLFTLEERAKVRAVQLRLGGVRPDRPGAGRGPDRLPLLAAGLLRDRVLVVVDLDPRHTCQAY